MNVLDREEYKKWALVRQKGKFRYMVKWILYFFLFMTLVHGFLSLVNGTEFGLQEVLIVLAISLLIGSIGSMLRWMFFEKRFSSSHDHNSSL
ncbi:hypothetical protein DX130_02525 [Paenibacillus paeoniae]|uniref:Uncharacterized protein n=2 Tax=Paenibacillus paeoniae TaxID=2292705 RepID=A0A371PID5_9BACL|nr:hypothetical protein DX130_02525 [Paenibacillus paeoniae]